MKIFIYVDFKEYNILERLDLLKTLLINNNYKYEIIENIKDFNFDKNIIITFSILYQYQIFKKNYKTNIYGMLDDKINFYTYLKKNDDLLLKNNIFLIPSYDEQYNGPNILKNFMIKATWGMGCVHNEIKYGNIYDFINQYKNTHQIQDLMDVKHIYGVSICCKMGKILGIYSYLTIGPISSISFNAERNNKIKYSEVKLFLKKIVERLDLNGILEFEFLIDNENKIYIMECNPRISGSLRIPLYFEEIIKPYLNNFHNKDIKEVI